MKRLLTLAATIATSSLLFTSAAAQAAPKLPEFKFPENFPAKFHVAGGITVTSTHDSTDKCSPGQAWTMTESVDLEINDKIKVLVMGNRVTSNFGTGNVSQRSRISGYRETNRCPPEAKAELQEPECDSFGGRSMSNLVPDMRLNGKVSIAMTRRGGGVQDLSCVSPSGVSSPTGTAITVLHHTFMPINLPLKVTARAVRKMDRGDKLIRVIRISGPCDRARVNVGGPGITPAAADDTCRVDGLFNVMFKRLND